ncbi:MULTISPECIES: DUF1453 domain-containing protein [Saccharopolyspora]|uniref:DUF1453 domain-containing protein n=1 Tax=Saccharopolyspora gregorii TaxID=33914 RepID=A0ABP6S2E8_9PSEU|nr:MULTISPECIES: DUF1453 domain-containing protein [unclassified Saccharopolyspora]MCA1188654.1 DUF1453 domain-containing protein [Saccharopolyspora sp. 6T]MCA1194409.1 DUF1453 domain-containing protein [Saccharopolyspora sp. 6V]MCA1228790.1 DUF1453 domain-containing protein [Saccharopolyspora sp. 6M]MCA1281057.1 DUF1453 domain-containing protein [Saccharopolyspora sp. 7B]
MSGPIEIILIVALIGYVLVRRFTGEPVEGKRMLLVPAVIAVVGAVNLREVPHSPAAIGMLVATAVISVVLGVLRGFSVRIYERDGHAMMRYTWVTAVLWVVNIAVKLGSGLLAGAVGLHAGGGITFSLGLTVLAEGVAILAKGVRGTGRIPWSRGRGDAAPVPSPMLDSMQRKARDAGDLRGMRSFAPVLDGLRDAAADRRNAHPGARR